VAALASDKAGPAAVAAFGRILSGYARRACSWGELEGRLAGVPLQKVGGWPGKTARFKQRSPSMQQWVPTAWSTPHDATSLQLQVAVAREVVRALVGLELRLRSGEALARLCAMWGDAGLHRGVRLLLVRDIGALAGEAAAQQVGVKCWLASAAACCLMAGLMLRPPCCLRAASP
jgi:hypothetical protein